MSPSVPALSAFEAGEHDPQGVMRAGLRADLRCFPAAGLGDRPRSSGLYMG